jgi:hypothetical protein
MINPKKKIYIMINPKKIQMQNNFEPRLKTKIWIIFLLIITTLPFAYSAIPTNQNVLCIYNSNISESKEICDYYVLKRPGAKSLGLNVPDEVFPPHERIKKESMNGDKFIEYIAKPIFQYVNQHPEMKITHLAIAKYLPIAIYDKANKYPGNNMIPGSDYKLIIGSTATLLAYEGNWRTATNLEDYILRSLPENYKMDTTVQHFDPERYKDEKLRFAVSHLNGFNIGDIKKMIDKAQEPAPNLSSVYFGMPVDYFGMPDKLYIPEMFGRPMKSVGINPDLVVSTRWNKTSYDKPLVVYSSWGVHQGYDSLWIAGNPKVRSNVSNRAVFNSIESWNAATMTGAPNQKRETNQGLIADAISPIAFGGTNYSNSFSAAFGNIYEPTTTYVVDVGKFFANYAAGLTIAEAFLKSYKENNYYSVNTIIGDPLMRIKDSPTNETIRIIYTNPGCLTQDQTKIDAGSWICENSNTKKECIGDEIGFANETICREGCFQGHCKGTDYQIINQSTIKLNKSNNEYAISFPVNVDNKTINEIFQTPPSANVIIKYKERQGYKTLEYNKEFNEWIGETERKFNSGEGIIVTALDDVTLTFSGTTLNTSPKVKLTEEHNLIGLPFCGDKYTASQVLKEISRINPNCDLISNAYGKSWPIIFWTENISENFKGNKIDFKLNNYEAYWIRCKTGTEITWKPTCNSNQPPFISITTPTNGQTFTTPANITITANANDPDGTITKVEFYLNTTLITTKTTPPYTHTHNQHTRNLHNNSKSNRQPTSNNNHNHNNNNKPTKPKPNNNHNNTHKRTNIHNTSKHNHNSKRQRPRRNHNKSRILCKWNKNKRNHDKPIFNNLDSKQ